MVQTEVKQVGEQEHVVHVHVPQTEYARVYNRLRDRLASEVKLPGFRPGKSPAAMLEQRFAGKLRQDTATELVQEHYITAIEQSGLTPATQPELDIPEAQPDEGFDFSVKVVTWPEVTLGELGKLTFAKTGIEVTDEDVQGVVERLMKNQVRYEDEPERAAEDGDELHVDFVGFVDGEPFEGGRGEDVRIVLGEGRFIPGFEEQLTGAKPGEDRTVTVTFPEEYGAEQLAGKEASFEVNVKRVARPEPPRDEEELAKLVGFDDAEALRADVRARLEQEAEQVGFEATREAAYDALLAAHEVTIPEAILREDVRRMTRRVAENMRQQGMQPQPEMFEEEAYLKEARERSERMLKLSLLLQSVREAGDIDVSDEELDAEIERAARQYPEAQREEYVNWLRGQREQVDALRERLLERKCVAYIASKARVSEERKSLGAWQEEQETRNEETSA